MIKLLFGLLCAFSAAFAEAQTRSKLKPLYFQADKNNLQVLPQRFEYTLIDEDQLKVGDVLIDVSQVTFQIEHSTNKKGTYQIHFTWPAGLLKDGEISIKNNSGKAILTSPVTPGNIKIRQQSTPMESGEPLRSEVATLSFDEIEASVVDEMKYYPFMVFCIYKESDATRLYLCSKELYLSAQQAQMDIKPRSAGKKSAQIEINGKIVGNQGIIYLNDRSENVVFKAQTQTGAFLEIETRKKDVDFKDVVISEDDTKLILTASGAEPVDEKKVKKISAQDWQITLPKSRPVLYLKGDGDIPMRQEFYIRGPLPKEKFRPYLSARSSHRTYSSTLYFNGVTPEGTKVSTLKDPESTLENTKKNQFLWTVSNIPAGAEVRRYLQVSAANNDFVVGYDMFRGQPYSLGVGAQYQTPSGLMFGTIAFQWWIENFLGMDADWSRFRWGLALERRQHLSETEGVAKVDLTGFEVLWRAQPGFNLVDPSWGVTIPLQMIQGESSSAMAYGIGGFISQEAPAWFHPFMSWAELKLQYYLGSSGNDFKLKSAYTLSAVAYHPLTTNANLHFGMELSEYKYDPSAAKEDLQIVLVTGFNWKF